MEPASKTHGGHIGYATADTVCWHYDKLELNVLLGDVNVHVDAVLLSKDTYTA